MYEVDQSHTLVERFCYIKCCEESQALGQTCVPQTNIHIVSLWSLNQDKKMDSLKSDLNLIKE